MLIVAYGINDIGWGTQADEEHRRAYLDAIGGILERCRERNIRGFLCSAAITAEDPETAAGGFLQAMCDEGLAIARDRGEGAIDVQRSMRAIHARSARTDSSEASGASPTTPDPATRRAAISPAMTVPRSLRVAEAIGVLAVADQVDASRDRSGQVRVGDVDTRVDDRDGHPAPGRPLVRRRGVQRLQRGRSVRREHDVPGLTRVVRRERGCHGGADQRAGDGEGGDAEDPGRASHLPLASDGVRPAAALESAGPAGKNWIHASEVCPTSPVA